MNSDISINRPKIEKKSSLKAFFGFLKTACPYLSSLLLPIWFGGSSIISPALAAPIAWLALVSCAVLLLTSMYRMSSIILFSLVIFSVINYSGGIMLLAIILGAIMSAGITAYSITAKRHACLWFIPLSLLTSLLLCKGNLLPAMSALVFYIPGLILGIASRARVKLNTSLILASISFFVMIAAMIASGVFALTGELTIESIRNVEFAFADYIIKNATELYADLGIPSTPELKLALTELVDILINHFAGALAAFCLIICYLAKFIQSRFCKNEGVKLHIEDALLEVSPVSAFLFIIAHIVSFTTAPDGNIAFGAIVAGNISLILLPVMILAGFDTVKLLAKKGPFGFLTVILLLIALFVISSRFSASILTLMAIIGAVGVMMNSLDRWAREYYKKGEHQ